MDPVIHFTSHAEDATNALQSILDNSDRFKTVYLVCDYYQKHVELFPGYNALHAALTEAHVKVVVVSDFSITNYATINEDAIIRLHPFVMLRNSGMDTLATDKELTASIGYERIRSIGVQSTIHICESSSIVWDLYYALTGYGFLMIMHFIDVVRAIYSRGKYYTSSDVQLQFLAKRNGRAYIEESNGYFRMERFWNRVQLPIRVKANASVYVPPASLRGIHLARYMMHQHNHQDLGLWWIPFGLFFYYWLAYPWWNHLSVPGASALIRPPVSALGFIYYLITLGGLYFSSDMLMYPQYFITAILFPVYLTLYPLFWMYSRLWRPRIKLKL